MSTDIIPPPSLKFAALVRGDDGGLAVRWFRTPQEAADACCAHEETAPRPQVALRDTRATTPTHILARELGMRAETCRRNVIKYRIPSIPQGPRSLMVPNRICILLKLYGFLGVRGMIVRGEL
ncbi:MAG: hypothetical protein JSS23_12375 [Proteobacteria bacterium]|nr:hypothetical protein [Pseudomonadota bacterium]